MIMSALFFIVISIIIIIASATTTTANSINDDDDGWERLVQWMIDNGGRVDERFQLESSSNNNNNNVRGVFALTDLEEGTELLFCPWKLIIGSTSMEDQMPSMCDAVKLLENEFRLGRDSQWHAYLDLDRSLVDSRLPALWGPAALEELQGPLQVEDAQRHLLWYKKDCLGGGNGEGNDDQLSHVTKQALISFVTRASQVGMVPIYDLLNHHNGNRNTKLEVSKEGVQLVTIRQVLEGQELYLSYGIKSSSTMFRDYGFVEHWPQIWMFQTEQGVGTSFVLFPHKVVAIHPTADMLKRFWDTSKDVKTHQSNSMMHTASLSPQVIRQFYDDAHDYLDSLPTSLEEDERILKDIKSGSGQQIENDLEQKDRVAAINFRLQFKIAMKAAIDAASKYVVFEQHEEL